MVHSVVACIFTTFDVLFQKKYFHQENIDKCKVDVHVFKKLRLLKRLAMNFERTSILGLSGKL